MQIHNPKLREALSDLHSRWQEMASADGRAEPKPPTQQQILLELAMSEEFSRCVDELNYDRTIAKHFGHFIAAVGIGHFHFQGPQQLLTAVFGSHFCQFESFDTFYLAFESAFYESDLTYSVIAPLEGWLLADEVHDFASNKPLIHFAGSIEIRRLKKDEEHLAQEHELVRKLSTKHATEIYGIVVDFRVPKQLLSAGQSCSPYDESKMNAGFGEAVEAIEESLQIVRTFKEGNVHQSGGLIRIKGPVFEGLTRSWFKALPSPFLQSGRRYSLDSLEELKQLQEFVDAITVAMLRGGKHLITSMRWLSYAVDQERMDDKLIHLLIACEALTQIAGTKNGIPISRKIAASHPEGMQKSVLSNMLDAYQVRNAILHQGDPNYWLEGNSGLGKDFLTVVYLAEAHLRTALKACILEAAQLLIEREGLRYPSAMGE